MKTEKRFKVFVELLKVASLESAISSMENTGKKLPSIKKIQSKSVFISRGLKINDEIIVRHDL
jgi:hypothetical protein